MLQQTQVERVKGFYRRFVRQYPSFADLAAADEPQVREAWDGLGYYARARNLQRTARIVVDEHAGRLPADAQVIRQLPGIGRYTAGAVLSIAYGQDEPILDTNAARVLQRWFGVRRARRQERAAPPPVGPRRAGHAGGRRRRLQPGDHGPRRHDLSGAPRRLRRVSGAQRLRDGIKTKDQRRKSKRTPLILRP